MNDYRDRERLRLELETFLREKYGLSEAFAAVPEDWDARGIAMMVFRVGPAEAEIMRAVPIEEFERWREALP